MNYKQLQRDNNKYLTRLRNNPTEAETIFRKWMVDEDVYFIFQKGFLKPFHRIVDFYIPKKKIIIEIDGEYHTQTKWQDDGKDRHWNDKGYQTIRIKNSEVMDGSFKETYAKQIQ